MEETGGWREEERKERKENEEERRGWKENKRKNGCCIATSSELKHTILEGCSLKLRKY